MSSRLGSLKSCFTAKFRSLPQHQHSLLPAIPLHIQDSSPERSSKRPRTEHWQQRLLGDTSRPATGGAGLLSSNRARSERRDESIDSKTSSTHSEAHALARSPATQHSPQSSPSKSRSPCPARSRSQPKPIQQARASPACLGHQLLAPANQTPDAGTSLGPMRNGHATVMQHLTAPLPIPGILQAQATVDTLHAHPGLPLVKQEIGAEEGQCGPVGLINPDQTHISTHIGLHGPSLFPPPVPGDLEHLAHHINNYQCNHRQQQQQQQQQQHESVQQTQQGTAIKQELQQTSLAIEPGPTRYIGIRLQTANQGEVFKYGVCSGQSYAAEPRGSSGSSAGWVAQLESATRSMVTMGPFRSQLEAARAYDCLVLEMLRENATEINFHKESYSERERQQVMHTFTYWGILHFWVQRVTAKKKIRYRLVAQESKSGRMMLGTWKDKENAILLADAIRLTYFPDELKFLHLPKSFYTPQVVQQVLSTLLPVKHVQLANLGESMRRAREVLVASGAPGLEHMQGSTVGVGLGVAEEGWYDGSLRCKQWEPLSPPSPPPLKKVRQEQQQQQQQQGLVIASSPGPSGNRTAELVDPQQHSSSGSDDEGWYNNAFLWKLPQHQQPAAVATSGECS